MKILKFALAVIMTAVSVLSCASWQNGGSYESDNTVRIAYLPITHSIPVMLLDDIAQDSDHDYKIELVRFNSWTEVVDALRTNRVDGASILFEVALRAKETDGNLVMVSLSHRDGNVIVVDNSISSYQDLIGKTVAIPHRLSPQNTLLRIVLERESINAAEINIIELSPAEMPFAMASGTISAYIVAEPYGSVAVSVGAGRILETSNEIYLGSVCCVMVFKKDLFESSGGLKDWMLTQLDSAVLKARKKDDEVVGSFKRHSNFSDYVIRASLLNTFYDDLFLSKEEYEKVTEIILRHGILDDVPCYEDFMYR